MGKLRFARTGRLVLCVAVIAVAGAALAGIARAAGPPVVVTGSTSALGSTSVTVAGTVNPNGFATTWVVNYGPTTSYGSATTPVSASSGTTAVDVSATLSSLTPGTIYHYRIAATNSAGTTNGADGAFTTPAPPAVTSAAASAVGPTTFTLSGTVDPRGQATTWHFEYGTTASYGSLTTSRSAGSGSGPLDVSVTITTAQPGQVYRYRLVATSAVGTTRTADRTVSTSSPPRVVTGGTSAVTPTGITLSGTVNPLGVATSAWFEYGTSAGYGSRTTARSVGSGTADVTTTAAVTGLRAGTLYTYRLVAASAAGTTNGADQTAMTVGLPDARTGAARSISGAAATLTGSIDSRGRATTWYFEYGTTTGYGTRTATQSIDAKPGDRNAAVILSNLKPSTTYHFRIVATSDAGTTRGIDQAFTTGAPPTPTTGTAVLSDGGAVTFTGTVNPNGSNTSWWFEFGATTTYGSRTPTRSAGAGSTAAAVSESITGLASGSTFHYRLVVSSDAGNVGGSDASVITGSLPTVVTGRATIVRATTAVVAGIVTTNGLATTWWIEFGPTQTYGQRTSTFSARGATESLPVRAQLAGLVDGRTVHYRLLAQNAAGGAQGADVTITTPLLPRTPSGRVVRCTIVGTAGRDVLRGTSRADTICGLDGSDVIYGNGGGDVIYGGPGNDRIVAGDGNDVVFAGAGSDRIDGGYGNDTIDSGDGNDTVVAGPGRDTVVTGRGRSTVNGGPGLDCVAVHDRRTTRVSAGVCPKRA